MNQLQREDILRLITMGVLGSRDSVPVNLHAQFGVLWDFTTLAVAKCLGINADRVLEVLGEIAEMASEDNTEINAVFATLIVDVMGRAEEPFSFADQQQWTQSSNEGCE